MSEDMIVYNETAAMATVTPKGKNYMVNCGGVSFQQLKRDVDFGVIPKTKKPSLFKSGAEKIAMGYGLLQQYEIESKIEQTGKDAMFYYLIKCNLVKVVNGVSYVLTSGYGSANTMEKRNGFNGAYDAANSTLKMAMKRALVAAAIAISGASDAFTQDMENEDFMDKAQAIIDKVNPTDPISTAQIRRLYAIAGEAGLSAGEAKTKLAAMGYTSTKQITQEKYEEVCKAIQEAANNG